MASENSAWQAMPHFCETGCISMFLANLTTFLRTSSIKKSTYSANDLVKQWAIVHEK